MKQNGILLIHILFWRGDAKLRCILLASELEKSLTVNHQFLIYRIVKHFNAVAYFIVEKVILTG